MDMKNNLPQHSNKPRAGEYAVFSTRSERFFEQESYWYFRTREGMDIGPFDTKEDAEEGVKGFISFLKEVHADVVVRINKYVRLQPRAGETEVPGGRSERIFEQNSYWYFRTREGMDIGPYDTRGEAVIGAKAFVNFIKDAQPAIVDNVKSYLRAV
jgi:hypothetical protein